MTFSPALSAALIFVSVIALCLAALALVGPSRSTPPRVKVAICSAARILAFMCALGIVLLLALRAAGVVT